MESVQENTTPTLHERITKVLEEGPAAALALANEVHSSDLAEALSRIPVEEAARLIQLLPFDTAVEIFDESSFSTRGQVLAELDLDLATALCEAMSPDERADLFHQISPDLAEVLRPRLSREVAQNLSTLLRYPEESAGGIMTTEFVTLRPHFTVKEAIDHIRTVADGVETIYYAYLVDASTGVLAGVVSLRELLIALPETPVREIMFRDPKLVRTDTDQEDVARILARYNLLAVPVVNNKGQIVGIVTVDDVLDVLVEEQSEDIHKLGAVEPTEAPYFLTGFFQMIRKRVVWLVILFVGGFFTETALRHYDAVLQQAIHLFYFLPLIIASGGNSGSQSATLVVRAMATGDVQVSQWWRVFSREFFQGLTLGLVLGLIGFFRAWLWGRPLDVSITVAATLTLVVTAGTTIGAMLPLLSKRLGFDPAVSSTPFIASLVDVTGIVIYIKVASFLLGL